MNPLDEQEFAVFFDILKQDMPMLTSTKLSVKHSFSQRFPKNMNDYSEIMDKKYLDSQFAVIDEIKHRDPSHWIPKYFLQYQNRVYGKSDILNHDNFFKAKLHDDWRSGFQIGKLSPKILSSPNHGNAFISFGVEPCTGGADLETASGSSSHGNFGFSSIQCFQKTGVDDTCYNEATVRLFSGTENVQFAAYDDDTDSPDVLYSESATKVVTTYVFQSMPLFTLVGAKVWLALQFETANDPFFTSSLSPNRFTEANTFGTGFPNPSAATTVDDTHIQMKIGKS